ncbi:MAG: hypothetical protein KME64_24480 [Scytonematopsis contorta HA4267-MV1]|nr:hypothetical protein [Scytonematopsis contorta HA4267-MV1]
MRDTEIIANKSCQQSTVNRQPSTVNSQPSTVNSQLNIWRNILMAIVC